MDYKMFHILGDIAIVCLAWEAFASFTHEMANLPYAQDVYTFLTPLSKEKYSSTASQPIFLLLLVQNWGSYLKKKKGIPGILNGGNQGTLPKWVVKYFK